MKLFDVQLSYPNLLKAYDEIPYWFANVWKDHRDVSVRDQLRFLIGTASQDEIKLHEDWFPMLQEAYASAFFELPPTLNPFTIDVLTWLHDQNKKIGIICNTGRTPGFALRRFLDQQGVRAREEQLRHYASEFPYATWIWAKDTANLAQGYQITAIPTTVIIDQAGSIRFRHVGVVDAATMSQEIEQLLQ